jgi:thiosulfate reductase cytochrome b subunit
MSERIFILPIWIRLWHWTNAVLILVLSVTGISLHFSAPGLVLVPFATAVKLHNMAGLALIAAYAVFVAGNIVSGNWWQYVPKPDGFWLRIRTQFRYYIWGIFHGEYPPYPPSEEANFNALQQIIYWIVMYLVMPTVILTGIIYLWPDLAPRQMFGVDGLLPIAVAHYLSGLVIVLFLIAHVYLGTCGGKVSTHFKMMITGWHEQ